MMTEGQQLIKDLLPTIMPHIDKVAWPVAIAYSVLFLVCGTFFTITLGRVFDVMDALIECAFERRGRK